MAGEFFLSGGKDQREADKAADDEDHHNQFAHGTLSSMALNSIEFVNFRAHVAAERFVPGVDQCIDLVAFLWGTMFESVGRESEDRLKLLDGVEQADPLKVFHAPDQCADTNESDHGIE